MGAGLPPEARGFQDDRKRRARVALWLLLIAIAVRLIVNIVFHVLSLTDFDSFEQKIEFAALLSRIKVPFNVLSSVLAITGFILLLSWKRMGIAAWAIGLDIARWAASGLPLILGGYALSWTSVSMWVSHIPMLVSDAYWIAHVLTLRRAAATFGARFYLSLAIVLYCLTAATAILSIVNRSLLRLAIGVRQAAEIRPPLIVANSVLWYSFLILLIGGTAHLLLTLRSTERNGVPR